MYQGRVRLGTKTKDLAKKLKPGEIAVIDHQDLDAMGALGLAETGIEVVLNAADSITGRYPNLGPKLLLERKIKIIDQLGTDIFVKARDGQLLRIVGNSIYINDNCIASGRLLDDDLVLAVMEQAKANIDTEVAKFVDNTIEYVQKEKDLWLTEFTIPKIKTDMIDRHVVVVVRGINYREDLSVIGSYIEEMNPV